MKEISNKSVLSRLKQLEGADATYLPSSEPLVYRNGAGSFVWDVEGNRFTDLCCGFGGLALGHNHPEIVKVQSQSDGLVHGLGDVYPSLAKLELLEELLSVLPDAFSKGLLSVTGGQAVETALKTAFLATGKTGVLSFERAYHGVDFGLLSLNGRTDFLRPFAPAVAAEHVHQLPWLCSKKQFDQAVLKLTNRGHEPACLLIEPIQGRGGGWCAPVEWLSDLRKWTNERGILLVFDEVMVGLGRTGRFSFSELVQADLLCFGKILGGGLPLSACVGTEEAMAAWPASRGEAIHTGTFFGHPLACRIGLETLRIIQRDGLLQRTRDVGRKAERFLREHLADVKMRSHGMMIVIDFEKPGLGAKIMDKLRAEGVIALAAGDDGSCLSLTPALNIDEDLLMCSLDQVVTTIDDL